MEEGKHTSYLANLKLFSSQRINEKFISTLHSLSPLNLPLYQFLKSLTRSINFLIFFPGSIWVSTQHQKGGMLQGKCQMSNCGTSTVWRNGRADDHETGGGGTMDPPPPRYPAPRKSASQVWGRMQCSQAWFYIAACLATFNPLFILSSSTH